MSARPGQGSLFWFELKVAPGAAAPDGAAAPAFVPERRSPVVTR